MALQMERPGGVVPFPTGENMGVPVRLTEEHEARLATVGIVIDHFRDDAVFPPHFGVQRLNDRPRGGTHSYYVLWNKNKYSGVKTRDFNIATDWQSVPRSPGINPQVIMPIPVEAARSALEIPRAS